MTWRDRAATLIAELVDEYGVDDLEALRKHLWKEYPWGPRSHWPYKVWLSEVKATMARLERGQIVTGKPENIKGFWVK